jgi:hypothetical protein
VLVSVVLQWGLSVQHGRVDGICRDLRLHSDTSLR